MFFFFLQEELQQQKEALAERLRLDHARELKEKENELLGKLTAEKNRLFLYSYYSYYSYICLFRCVQNL